MHRVHVLISGKVQGVYFRDSTREQAMQLGVNGWVRNLPDGRVEGVFEGERKAIDELVRWCERGPQMAAVEAVVVEIEEEIEGFDGFGVRSTRR